MWLPATKANSNEHITPYGAVPTLSLKVLYPIVSRWGFRFLIYRAHAHPNANLLFGTKHYFNVFITINPGQGTNS